MPTSASLCLSLSGKLPTHTSIPNSPLECSPSSTRVLERPPLDLQAGMKLNFFVFPQYPTQGLPWLRGVSANVACVYMFLAVSGIGCVCFREHG